MDALLLIIQIILAAGVVMGLVAGVLYLHDRIGAKWTLHRQRRMYETEYEREVRLEKKRLERRNVKVRAKDLNSDEEAAIIRARNLFKS